DKNYGHLVLWDSGRFDDVILHSNFVLNDCDVLPVEDCPADVVERLAKILERYPNFTKVGLSLKIDDLPDHYALKPKVLEWEAPFWEHPLENATLYEAAVDTTFAYYRPGITPKDQRWWRSLRTAAPLTARHLPWYADTSHPSAEDIYYQTHLKGMSSQWSTTDPVLLKEQNIKLQMEVHALRKELALLKQSAGKHLLREIRQQIVACLDKLGLGRVARALYRLLTFWRRGSRPIGNPKHEILLHVHQQRLHSQGHHPGAIAAPCLWRCGARHLHAVRQGQRRRRLFRLRRSADHPRAGPARALGGSLDFQAHG